jgi:hypothetical protein
MSGRTLLPPILAIAVVGIWGGSQRSTLSATRGEIGELRAAIDAPKASDPRTPGPASRARRTQADRTHAPVDWLSLARHLEEAEGGGISNIQATLEFQKQVREWTVERILEALEEIANLDLPESQRLNFEIMLIGPLGEKDPRLALERFSDRLGDQGGWLLVNTMSQWLNSDQTAAIAWMDEAIGRGLFASKALDGRSQERIHFEAAIIPNLLKTDLASAQARIRSMTNRDRSEVLSRLTISDIPPRQYVDLVRGSLDEPTEIQQVISSAATAAAHRGGFERAETFINEAGLDPESRKAAIEQTASSKIGQASWRKAIGPTELDEMRQWVSKQSPGSEDRLTGKVIADAMNNGSHLNFERASELATQYWQSSGNEEVIATFLETAINGSHREKAIPLIENLSDPERRQALLDRVSQR